MEKKIYLKQGVAFEGFPMSMTRSSVLAKVLIFLFILLVAAGAGAYALRDYQQKNPSQKPLAVKPTNTPVPQVEPTQEATPTASLTKSPTPTKASAKSLSGTPTTSPTPAEDALTVIVQNGSGVAGVAKTMSDYLTGKGYEVVSAGNADAFTYTDVTIQIKKSKKAALPTLVKDISGKYTVGDTTTPLVETSKADAVVIVGK